ncbi:MAG: Arm DNA-binding domain-containing protein [Mycobacteriaceae bacterium]
MPEFDAKGNRKRCTKRGCGSWYFHFEGMSAGRRVQYKRGGYVTRRDAEAALAEVVDNRQLRLTVAGSHEPFVVPLSQVTNLALTATCP